MISNNKTSQLLIIIPLLFIFLAAGPAYAQLELFDKFRELMKLNEQKFDLDTRHAALTSFHTANFKEAAMFAKKHLKLFPNDREVLLMLCQSLLWSGDPAGAAAGYLKFFKLGGERSAAFLFQYSECLRAQSKYKEAAGVLNEAKAVLKTAEIELMPNIDLGLGYCYLETGDLKKAGSYFSKVKNTRLANEYYDAMGDRNIRLNALETEENYFDVSKMSFEKRISRANLEKALKNYQKNFELKNESTNPVRIKIADALWGLDKREEAVKTMTAAENALNNEYASMRLAYFLMEENKSSETVLKKCIRLLEKAQGLGQNKAEAELEKIAVYELLKDETSRKNSIRIAARLSSGDEWFGFALSDKLLKCYAGLSEISDYSNKLKKSGKFPDTAMLLDAFVYSKKKADIQKALEIIREFLSGKMPKNYDNLNMATNIYTALEYEVRLKNNDISNMIELETKKMIASEVEKKVEMLDSAAHTEKNDSNLYAMIEMKAGLYAGIGDIAKALEYTLDSLKYCAADFEKTRKTLLKAYEYSVFSANARRSDEIAKKLLDHKIYEKEPLKLLIYSNYWDGDKALAEECLKRLAEIDPKSPVVPAFDGLKLSAENKRMAAVKKFREAIKNGGEKDYIEKQIEAEKKKAKPTVNPGYYYVSDSTGQTKINKSVVYTMLEDGYNILTGVDTTRLSKKEMFRGTLDLTTSFKNIFLGFAMPLKKFNVEARIIRSSLENNYLSTREKFFQYFKVFTQGEPFNYSLTYYRRFLEDTPLSLEMGLFERIIEFVANYSKNKFYSMLLVQTHKLSDGNSRLDWVGSAGYKIHKYTGLKLIFTKDNMDHEYSGDATYFAPFEVYYAPNNVSSKALGVDYTRSFNKFNLSAAAVIYGKETRNAGPDSKFRNFSATLNFPAGAGSSFDLSFYGAKSDINPISDQTTNSQYIDREIYLKYMHKF